MRAWILTLAVVIAGTIVGMEAFDTGYISAGDLGLQWLSCQILIHFQ